MKKLVIPFLTLVLFGFKFADNDSMKTDQLDGPYVQYKDERVFAKYIVENNGTRIAKIDSIALLLKQNLPLLVQTDVPGKTFSVQLKKQLQNEKSEFKKVSKLFVLSDIEGNFSAFRKLLQMNKVIDETFNWNFGDGHLVLIGDFFDRGEQVTEVLWLIYSLEEKAKAAGGYVHFILGNHEIMNLSGDIRYVHKKYMDNARVLNEQYECLYGENSELGRWLRTKNIIEKVGKNLFVHAGISNEINRLDLPISKINKLARPYYADSTYTYKDKRLAPILVSDAGPFWYRGYYLNDNKATPQQIDSTLALFDVRHIVTGHTIVADTVSVWHNGKVINTDIKHADGKSEALLIEGDKYYRVNAEGKKVLLM